MAPDPVLDPLLDKRKDLTGDIRNLNARRKDVQEKIEKVRQERKELDARGSCLDGCSMPHGLKLVFLDARDHGWSGSIYAADRTQEHCDDCSDKMSQQQLWDCFQAKVRTGVCPGSCGGNCNPANPPKSSSHEYVNGGNGGSPAYSNMPVGAKLDWWQLGVDATEAAELVAVLNRLGYGAKITYTTESWHINLTKNPHDNLIKRGRV